MDNLEERIAKANAKFLGYKAPTPMANKTNGEDANVVVSDLYQERQKIQNEYTKKSFPRGSSERVLATIKDVVDGAGTRSLAQAYERAKDDSEVLKEAGEQVRAQMVINDYIQNSFLPAVEVVVNFTSPDEVLNCKEGLDILDGYALGVGKMKGYTGAYLREAYSNSLGQVQQLSSPEVSDAVRRINGYLDTGQNILAKSLANKIKEKIKEGKVVASETDYNLIAITANNKK